MPPRAIAERDEVRDTESKGHSLIDSQEFDSESQDAGCDRCRQ